MIITKMLFAATNPPGCERRGHTIIDSFLKFGKRIVGPVGPAPAIHPFRPENLRHFLKIDFREDTIRIKDYEIVAERSEEHTSELQSRGHLVCRLLLAKKKA